MDAQRLAEKASSSTRPLNLITLRQADHDRVHGARSATGPASSSRRRPKCCATDDRFAPAIINEVKKSVVDELDGEAGWRVVSVNQNGADVDVLNEVPARRRRRSRSAWTAPCRTPRRTRSNMVGKKAMIVAIKPSTGEILAVAQNAAADADGPTATTGLYPPGSTFKIVTAGAAIDRDMATPNTLLGCPGRSTSATAPCPTTAASTSAPCRCRGPSRARATPPSPNWPARCRRAG